MSPTVTTMQELVRLCAKEQISADTLLNTAREVGLHLPLNGDVEAARVGVWGVPMVVLYDDPHGPLYGYYPNGDRVPAGTLEDEMRLSLTAHIAARRES